MRSELLAAIDIGEEDVVTPKVSREENKKENPEVLALVIPSCQILEYTL